jgi:hypothetical protein
MKDIVISPKVVGITTAVVALGGLVSCIAYLRKVNRYVTVSL